jgi:hypothetical protein
MAGGSIGRDGGLERVGAQLEPLVRRDPDQRRPAEAERHARLLDRGVRLLRRVDAERGHVFAPGDPRRRGIQARGLPSGGQGDQRRRGGGVGQQAVKARRQSERLAEPVDDDLFELGSGR